MQVFQLRSFLALSCQLKSSMESCTSYNVGHKRPALASFHEYSRMQFDVLPWCPTLWLLESGDTEILALSARPLFSAPPGTQSALSFVIA